MLIFLLSFHIVSLSSGLSLIPKDHLSFADTFVNVDHLIQKYNDRTLGEKLRGEGVSLYLIRKLRDKGIVSLTVDKVPSQDGRSITMAMYDRVRTGMRYSEVISILGRDGQELSRNELDGIVTVMYQWTNEDGSNMNILLQNGGVVQKAQFGLR